MQTVKIQARMPGEIEWKTRNTFSGHNEQSLFDAARMIEEWRSNYRDAAELRLHVE